MSKKIPETQQQQSISNSNVNITQKPPVFIKTPISAHSTGGCRHPIQRLNERACELSGVDFDEAFKVDEMQLGERIGEFNMAQVSERFHRKVVDDKDPWFRDMFTSSSEDFVSNQSEYLLQRLGGPNYYSDRRGTPNLITR